MNKKAMVVDDSVTSRSMAAMTLKKLGFDVEMAKDGKEAFDIADNHNWDVIVTDINMPNIDGIELIRMLRENTKKCKNVPILVISTEGGGNVKTAGKTAGANGWIVKPFSPQILQNAVTKLCNLK